MTINNNLCKQYEPRNYWQVCVKIKLVEFYYTYRMYTG